MKLKEPCVQCLLDNQMARAKRNNDDTKTARYMEAVKQILETHKADAPAPYLVALFDEAYAACFGKMQSYAQINKACNDLVLRMEDQLMEKIQNCADTKEKLARALVYARIGNYIDYGVMDHVDTAEFLACFENAELSAADRQMFDVFYEECSRAKTFLLISDNCGEIVLDKLMIRVLKTCFPQLEVRVLVRGSEALNDATMEDALYVGMDREAKLISNGTPVAGTIYEMISEEARMAIDQADVILSKGQGNFETLSGQGRHIYYAFLCKCEVFTNQFQVPKLTGMFVADL